MLCAMKKMPEDLNNLEKRIADFKSNDVVQKRNEPLTNSSLFAKAFVLGTEFVGAVLVGVGIGLLLDRVFNSKIVFTIIFTLFGCVAGVLNMYRSTKEMEKELK